MRHVNIEYTLCAVKNCICPHCRAVPFFTAEWSVIRVNDNLAYCQCLRCNIAFKFMRRTLNHINDSTGWEYILQDMEGKLYGIRGYYISMKTYKKNFSQYQLIRNYYQYSSYEIDDIFKYEQGHSNQMQILIVTNPIGCWVKIWLRKKSDAPNRYGYYDMIIAAEERVDFEFKTNGCNLEEIKAALQQIPDLLRQQDQEG